MRIVTALCLMLLISGAVYAAPGGGDMKPWSYGFQPRATVPEVEPNNTCPGQAINCGDLVSPASFDVATDDDWYQFYAPAGTVVTTGTQGYQGSDFDTYLELYASDCVSRLTYDDDGGPNMFSLISNFTLPTTGNFNIHAYSYAHYYTGMYELFLNCGGVTPPPENDQCSGAIEIPCGSGALQGDLTNAAADYDPGSNGCCYYPEVGKDVAYKLTNLPAGSTVSLSYTQLSADGAIYIVTDCANVPGTCLVGADDTVTGQAEVINWTAPSTGTYYIICDAYGTAMGGPWTMTYNIVCANPQPGACCFGQECQILLGSDCERQGGVFKGDNTVCDPNPCLPVPVQSTTWGQIKSNYK